MKNKTIYFITATNTNVGKTRASKLIMEKEASLGNKVGYFKPIETGVKTNPLDATAMLSVAKKLNNTFNVTIDDIIAYPLKLAAAPYVAAKAENIDIDIKYITKKAENLLNFCDTLIIEGAGGLMVPIKKDYFMIDLIKEFNCQTILISPSNLGSINDTLLSHMALEKYNIKYTWYINLFKDKESFEKITLPFYKEYFSNISFI